MKTKKKHYPMKSQQIRCPYCGAVAQLRSAAEIYKDDSCTGELYVCANYPACNSYVHVYPHTRVPMGELANGDLRHLRIRAHRTFDQIWKTGIMTRENAYRWMAEYFGLSARDAHIGKFSEYRCKELITKCESVLAKCGRTA